MANEPEATEPMVSVSVKMGKGLLHDLEEIAKRDERTVSNLLRKLAIDFVRQHKQARGTTVIDAGTFGDEK
jgi:metal-responsive CopG/Arc/MetJ family transcriptional regulator